MKYAPLFNTELITHFPGRMDAVSDNDLDFWVVDPIGKDYYGKSTAPRGSLGLTSPILTRLFIINAIDLTKRFGEIVRMLNQHFADGVGFALAINETMENRKNIESEAQNN
jgi:hypothetical protein